MNHLQIENRKGKLNLNDGIHKDSADKLIDELSKLYGPDAVAAKMTIGDVVCAADGALESVEVEINSPGGSVFEGQRIYNALRQMSRRGVEIVTTVNGLAASMGSVILLAGDKRNMTKGSRIMIHEASTIAWGDARSLRKNADLLEGISAEIAEIYADRTGGEKDAIRNLMFAETWMTADEAKTNGFVHAVLSDAPSKKAKAEFDTVEKNMSIFAKLFPGNDEALKIEAAINENDTLRAELIDAQAKIDELAGLSEANAAHLADLVTAQAKANDLEIKIGEFESKVAEYDIKVAELTAANEITAEAVSLRAAELLASQGHPAPVVIDDNGEAQNKILTVEAFNALKPFEKMQFFKDGGKLS